MKNILKMGNRSDGECKISYSTVIRGRTDDDDAGDGDCDGKVHTDL